MHSYNIVGDGTPQAFLPILTGKTEVELPLTRKRYKNANYVDVYPWIWNVRAPHVRAGYTVCRTSNPPATRPNMARTRAQLARSRTG